MRKLRYASLLGLILTAVFFMAVSAADTTTTGMAKSEVSGTFVGTRGGTYATWNVTLPENKDVTLTLSHWPCQAGAAVGFHVWNAGGMLADSSEIEACKHQAKFNTGKGGWAEIQAYNYLDGVGVWYTLEAEDLNLSSGTMAKPKMMAAKTNMMATKTMTTTAEAGMMKATKAETGTMAAKPMAMTAKPAKTAKTAAATDSLHVYNQALLGNSGGAFGMHNLMVKEGKSYTLRMTYVAPDAGGSWPAVGFNVWGPGDKWVAASHAVDNNTAEATFTADGNVMYLVQPYNYHQGVGILYNLWTVDTMSN